MSSVQPVETPIAQSEKTPLRKAVETVIPPEKLAQLIETVHHLKNMPQQALESLKSQVEARRIVAENLKAANAVAELSTQKIFDNEGVYVSVMEAHHGGWNVYCSSRPSEANNRNKDYFGGILHYGSYTPKDSYKPTIDELRKKAHLDRIEILRQEKSPTNPTKQTIVTLRNEGKGKSQKWQVEEASEGIIEEKEVKESGYFKSNGPFMDQAFGREFATSIVKKQVYTPQRHAQNPAEVQALASQVVAKL